MAVSAVALLAAGCGNEQLVVPKVTSVDSDIFEVYERLSDAGFTVEVTDGFRTGTCQCANPIVEQWPPAGTRAERGSAVEITVGGPGFTDSHGVRPLPFYTNVPVQLAKLVGLRLDSADRWLVRHHVGWSAELPSLPATKGDDLLNAYVVTAQQPWAGDYVKIGDSVSLTAAPAKDILAQWRGSPVVVPHVNGYRDLVSAYDRLHARGLAVATNRRFVRSPYVRVLGQEPPAGSEVRRRTTVMLILDPKLDHRPVCCDQRRLTMPDFVGRNLGEVSDWLFRRYLYWRLDAPALPPTNRPHLFDPYVVTSQKPVPGTKIPESIPAGSGDEIKPIVLRANLVAG